VRQRERNGGEAIGRRTAEVAGERDERRRQPNSRISQEQVLDQCLQLGKPSGHPVHDGRGKLGRVRDDACQRLSVDDRKGDFSQGIGTRAGRDAVHDFFLGENGVLAK
jgi:hypothetical protein